MAQQERDRFSFGDGYVRPSQRQGEASQEAGCIGRWKEISLLIQWKLIKIEQWRSPIEEAPAQKHQ